MAQDKPDIVDMEEKIQELVQIYESRYPGNQPEKIPALTQAAEAYRRIGIPSKALPLYEEILTLQEASERQPSKERVTTLGNLSLMYALTDRFDEALTVASAGLTILLTYYQDESAAIYSAMNSVASYHMAMKRYAEAEGAYLELLKLSRSSLKANTKSIAATHNNLGALYYEMKQFPKAEKMYLASLSLKKQIFAETHTEAARTDVGFTLFNLSQLYAHLGQNEKAAKMKAEATKTWGFSPPKDDPDNQSN